MSEIEFSTGGGFAYAENTAILFQFSSAADKFTVEKPTNPVEVNRLSSGRKITPWGIDNLFPQHVIEVIKQNNTLSNGFSKRFRAIFSNGVVTKKWAKDAEGNDILVKARFTEFEEFQRKNKYGTTYTFQAIRDLLRFYIAFPELVLSGDQSEIVAIKAQKAVNCRFSEQDKADGFRKTCYINAQWESEKEDSENTTDLNVIYEEYDIAESFRERLATLKNKFNFIFPISLPSDNNAYPWADWMTIIESGWLDVNNGEPKFIKALIENKATVNYVIKIKDWYWTATYADWGTIDRTEKLKRKKEIIDSFNKMVTGLSNSGKTMIIDVQTGLTATVKDFTKFSEAWEVDVLPQNKFDGALKEDSNTARMEIMFSIDLDPSTFGSAPQQNRQGGSDKQQSYNIGLTMDELFRHYIVLPYYFIRDFNGWSADMEFDFELPVMQTLANMSPKDRQTKPQD